MKNKEPVPEGSCIGAYERFPKRALIRTILCLKDMHYECGAVDWIQDRCPVKDRKECSQVTPADWWDADVLQQYKGITPKQAAEYCRRGACPVEIGCCPFWPTPDGWCCLVTDEMWEAMAE